MPSHIPSDDLVRAGERMMDKVGKQLRRLPAKGRAMIYTMANGQTVRMRTCNDHLLLAVAQSPDVDAPMNIEGTDWLLLVMPEVPRTLGNVVAYLVPTEVAAREARACYEAWLDDEPNTRGQNTTRNLWFDDDGPAKAKGYARHWSEYKLEATEWVGPEPSAVGGTTQQSDGQTAQIAAKARFDIAQIAGVPESAVKITIDLSQ